MIRVSRLLLRSSLRKQQLVRCEVAQERPSDGRCHRRVNNIICTCDAGALPAVLMRVCSKLLLTCFACAADTESHASATLCTPRAP